ncbi:hypothetical protein ACGGZK_14705 [Agromyces sp. MMS24-K17]|uniref:hypothetical protein n=1 Tax=Agromyces sp. MMS24-K17 TaxID=3372850 RepID=UPI003754537E
MISFDDARELARAATGHEIAAHGWEDADAYLVLRARGPHEPIPVGEQPLIVSKATGVVSELVAITNGDRIDRMKPIGRHGEGQAANG